MTVDIPKCLFSVFVIIFPNLIEPSSQTSTSLQITLSAALCSWPFLLQQGCKKLDMFS